MDLLQVECTVATSGTSASIANTQVCRTDQKGAQGTGVRHATQTFCDGTSLTISETSCSGLQDNWFDDTDESADGSVESPVAPTQTWKVHQGLGAGDIQSAGIMNAAFLQGDAMSSKHGQQLDDHELDTF